MPPTESALYDTAIEALFESLTRPRAVHDRYDFLKSDLEVIITHLHRKKMLPKIIKNIPDIKYTYDARRDFPASIASTGFWAVVGRGKSKYSFVRLDKNNLIRVPDDLPGKKRSKTFTDKTPKLVSSVLGEDEQATFARVRYNDLLGDFLGLTAYQVQSHERTTVSAGQIEVDEVYVGEVYVGQSSSGSKYVIPISGKGGDKDCLSYSQVYNLNLYAAEKTRYQGLGAIPIGIVRKSDGAIWMIRFSTERDVSRIKIVDTAKYTPAQVQ